METGDNKKFEPVYTTKVRAGKRRTYFFDVRETKGGDFFITLTESTRKFNGNGYDRHKIFLYKEDFNRFSKALNETVDHVKNDLMPDYDYDEFTRRQEEWEREQAENPNPVKSEENITTEENTTTEEKNTTEENIASEEDMGW